MNRSVVVIDSLEHSNSEGLIERQNCQYPLYLYADIPDETLLFLFHFILSLQFISERLIEC
jgi:hypothetical protein